MEARTTTQTAPRKQPLRDPFYQAGVL